MPRLLSVNRSSPPYRTPSLNRPGIGLRIRKGQSAGDIVCHANPKRPTVILVEAALNIAHRLPIDQTAREIVGKGAAVIRALLLGLRQLDDAFRRQPFIAKQRVPEILECHLMSGQFDYLLRVAAADASDYERIHRSRISRLPGVQRIQSSLALRTVKGWAGYPI